MPTNSSAFYCPVVTGIAWTLYREKCYYGYSAPFGIKEASQEDYSKHYKTWFEAREECTKLGAKLASVHDQPTQEKLMELIAGNEKVTSLREATWIGLQVGRPVNVTYTNEDGEVIEVETVTGCFWPNGVRPRLAKDDPCPENAVEKCSVPYNETFHGQWEDGKLYDEAESAEFWGPDEPSGKWISKCRRKISKEDEQSQAYCERGVDGKPDKAQHCAQILPADEKHIQIEGEERAGKQFAGKWTAYWCWMKARGYICERPARRFDGSEDSKEETQPIPPTPFCGVETTAMLDVCASRADEIELQINATRVGNGEVIEPTALGGPDAEGAWLGGSVSLADLALSATEFGRNLGKLLVEECFGDSRFLRLELQDLSKTMEESYEKVKEILKASSGTLLTTDMTTGLVYRGYLSDIQYPLTSTYESATGTLDQDNELAPVSRSNLMIYCRQKPTPEDIIMKMLAYFMSPAPEDETSDLGSNLLLELVEYEPDSKTKVQTLMVEVGAVARIGLTSLGICAQLGNVSERRLNGSRTKAINVLNEVNDAFKRALQNNTPAVRLMKEAAMDIVNRLNGELGAKRWSDRDELHQKIVNRTVDALKTHRRNRYVFNALASLPDKRTDQQCQLFPRNNFVNVGYRDLNYFILHANERRKSDRDIAWHELMTNEAARDTILDRVFAKSSESLCKRLTDALNAADGSPTAHLSHGFRTSRFGGVAAVKCGYEFVWYELGYTYFYAAHSSTGYKWQKKGGAYDVKCGQIFFFP